LGERADGVVVQLAEGGAGQRRVFRVDLGDQIRYLRVDRSVSTTEKKILRFRLSWPGGIRAQMHITERLFFVDKTKSWTKNSPAKMPNYI